jgi:micrococcal nuclease
MKWLLLCLLALLVVPHVYAEMIRGEVIAIRDADTIALIDDNNEEIWVRLAEIDLPEKFQFHGDIAREVLKEKTYKKRVRIELQGEDPYGRLIGNVYVEDDWINRELVEEGHAWHFRHHSNNPELEYAEKTARADGLNLWEQDSPMPPWEFRERQKTQRVFTIAEYLDRRTRVPDAYDAIKEEEISLDAGGGSGSARSEGGIAVPTAWLERGPTKTTTLKKKTSSKGTQKKATTSTRAPTTRTPSRSSGGSYGSGSK